MNFKLDTPSCRIAFTIGISVLLHGLLLWVPNIELQQFKPSLQPLLAKLEALPSTPAKLKPNNNVSFAQKSKPKIRPTPRAVPEEETPLAASSVAATSSVADTVSVAAESSVVASSSVVDTVSVAAESSVVASSSVVDTVSVAAESSVVASSSVAAASATPVTETLAQPELESAAERPPLPRRAQLKFAVYKGTSNFMIGKVMHTLEIDDGHYVLQSVTETMGLAKLIKSYKLTQYSSGKYSKQGLQPENFFEERAESQGTQRSTLEFDYTSHRAHFSHGGETVLPPDTQDILSILYQFPLLAHNDMVTIFVSNGKKIERYEFEIAANEYIITAMGKLHTVHLRKLHQPNEEGLEIWLALEYRLFPVKMRIIERNGEISGESIITDIRAEFEEEKKQDVDH